MGLIILTNLRLVLLIETFATQTHTDIFHSQASILQSKSMHDGCRMYQSVVRPPWVYLSRSLHRIPRAAKSQYPNIPRHLSTL